MFRREPIRQNIAVNRENYWESYNRENISHGKTRNQNLEKKIEHREGYNREDISSAKIQEEELEEEIEQKVEEPKKLKCSDCMEYRNGNCSGVSIDICDDFQFAPTLSKEETKFWPKRMRYREKKRYHNKPKKNK